MTKTKAYFDYAAATPVDPEIRDYFVSLMEQSWANPSSTHSFGQKSRSLLENARQSTATTLNCKSSEIYFTNSATEANNLALINFAKIGRVITSSFEHDSVANIHTDSWEVVEPDTQGLVDVQSVIARINDKTRLISVMWVNNELGTIQDIQGISHKLKEINLERLENGLPRVLFHTDAVQAPNYIKINLQELGVDMLTLSSQKVYAPRGAALLYVRDGLTLEPLIYGGGQESGLWPGTQNVLSISAFAKALVKSQRLSDYESIEAMQQQIIDFAQSNGIGVNGSMESRVPGNIHLSFKNIDQDELLTFMDLQGIAVSSGSSCASGSNKESLAVQCLKLPLEYTTHLRITFGRFTTKKEIKLLLSTLQEVMNNLT